MPEVGLPTGASRAPRGPGAGGGKGGRGFKRGGGRGQGVGGVAHDITGKKERTEDVVTGESREKTFADLLLSSPVLTGLDRAGFVQPSPVQLLAIPPAKVGFDLIVQSKSGTGKTCVYVVAALEMLKPDLPCLQALVLAPTREIAIQGVTVAMQVGQELDKVKMAAFIGGISLAEDKMKAKTCQLCVGTPGRLKQLISEGLLAVDSVRLAVLDEADKLLEPSFLADTTAILNMLPKSKQVLALSATYPEQLASLAERFMRSPQHIRPGQASQVLTGVAQFLHTVQHCQATARQTAIKQGALLTLLSSVPYTQCLVFSNYSTIAQSTADFLNSRGFPAIFISAGQDQTRRLAAMQTFKQFNCRILCSTDLTARGIDAENVNLVINLEVPWEQNTYLHRIGRGGRYGSHSLAITLASQGVEVARMRGVVRKTGSIVRILPAELPRDIRGEMETMEVLEAEGDDEKGKDTETEEVAAKNSENIEEGNKKRQSISSGKVKRRGKRKINEEITEDGSCEDANANTKRFEEIEDKNSKDKEIIKNFLDERKIIQPQMNLPSLEDIAVLVQKLEMGEVVEEKDINEELVDMEKSDAVGHAVVRLSRNRREDYRARVEETLKNMEGKELSLLLEKLLVGDPLDDSKQAVDNPSGLKNITKHKENSRFESGSKDTFDSESSSDDSESESSSDESTSGSSSSSGTESDSSTTTDSDSDSQPSSYFSDSQHAAYPLPSSYPGYPPPPPGHPAGYPPPPPGHPAAHAWYSQWAGSLAMHRLTVQQEEYNKYMQYLARK